MGGAGYGEVTGHFAMEALGGQERLFPARDVGSIEIKAFASGHCNRKADQFIGVCSFRRKFSEHVTLTLLDWQHIIRSLIE